MKPGNQIKLIPRNNWDFGPKALLISLTSAFNHSEPAINVENIFRQKPIFTNSGRTSLYAILRALDLPAGAQVGVPLFCCSVVFNAISQAGLSPRFLDSNMDDCNLSVEDLRQKRDDLSAIVPVHMFGKPVDIDAIMAVADEIPVIEDCAQSIFSTYKGRQTGLLSTASFFSFRCGKYISAGEGSAIFCRDVELHEKIGQIVNSFERGSTLGMVIDSLMTFVKATLYNRPWYGLVGYPIGRRLDTKLNLTAKEGFGAEKIAPSYLGLIDDRIANFQQKIERQRQNAQNLLTALEPGNYALPSDGSECTSNWFQFAIKFQDEQQRDVMADYLFGQGIDTAKYLDDIAEVAYSNYGYAGDCPNAEKLSKTILLIPIYYRLSQSDIVHIARSINEGSKLI